MELDSIQRLFCLYVNCSLIFFFFSPPHNQRDGRRAGNKNGIQIRSVIIGLESAGANKRIRRDKGSAQSDQQQQQTNDCPLFFYYSTWSVICKMRNTHDDESDSFDGPSLSLSTSQPIKVAQLMISLLHCATPRCISPHSNDFSSPFVAASVSSLPIQQLEEKKDGRTMSSALMYTRLDARFWGGTWNWTGFTQPWAERGSPISALRWFD